MSRLDQLLAELCPQGVEFRPLKGIGTWYGGGTPSKQKPEFWSGGTIPWLSPKDMRRAVVTGTEDYITDAAVKGSATKLVPANSVAMVVRSSILDHTLPTALVTVPVTLNQDMKAVVPNDTVLPEYLAHLMRSLGPELLRTVRKSGGSVASLQVPKLLAREIPVPPLAVQGEIARILDKMESLRVELEAELEAELEYRSRQYAFYRDQLLTFREAEGIRWVPMGEVTSGISSGKNTARDPQGAYPVYGSTGVIGYTGKPAYSGDALLVARVGANAGRVNAVGGEYDVSDNTLVVTPTSAWDVRFAFHQLVHANINQYAVGGGQPLVTGGLLKNLVLALPPLEQQRSIASTLDKFDALVNDLSSGLPAEVAARQKQYEYYRDKLLTFKAAA